jgi:hypothetical protein
LKVRKEIQEGQQLISGNSHYEKRIAHMVTAGKITQIQADIYLVSPQVLQNAQKDLELKKKELASLEYGLAMFEYNLARLK